VDGFRDLDVHRRANVLADKVHAAVADWASFAKWSVGLQMVRAADSVGANIAEGAGRYGPADHRRFLFIARSSSYELQHWIERAEARNLTVPEGAMQEAMELSRMLNGLTRNLPEHRPND
jgi:four helix bundle protein